MARNPDRVSVRRIMDDNKLVGLQYYLRMIQSNLDSGTYECRAENVYSTSVATKRVTVVVNPRPQTVTPTNITNVG